MNADGTFVLTTGRAGSTFLAGVLHAHPEIVVVSDLLEPALAEVYFDPDVHLDGAGFWEVLTRPSLPERIAYWRERPTAELRYLPPLDRDVSLLMTYTLPFLTDHPWALRAELGRVICARPRLPAPAHFRFVLDHLRDRFGATTWVERTGGSLPHTASIVAQFPRARFVTLRRDPVETALSMRTGSFFRLYLAMASGEAASWRRDEFADPVALAAMIETWTVAAERALATVPPGQLHHLTYERLAADPRDALLELIGFVLGRDPSAVDVGWAAEHAQQAVVAPRHATGLPAAELARIRAACPEATRYWDDAHSTGR